MKFFVFVLCLINLSNALSIQDNRGKEITIPKKINRIIVVGGMWPLPSIITLLDSSAKKIVYMPKATSNALKESVLSTFYPEISNIPNGNTENIEEILKFKADIAFCHQANKKLCQSLEKIGIPTIVLSVNIDNYNYKLTLKSWLEIVGKVLGKEDLAQKLIAKNELTERQIATQLQATTKRPKVLIIHRYDNNEIIADGLFANYLLNASGAKNIFPSFSSSKKVSLEEIYSLNPDIIYITNFTQAMPKDILNSKLYEGIQAIKTKQVYKIPLGSYRWFAPSAEFSVFLMWLAKINHPDIFSSIDIEDELSEHFKEFYHQDLDKSQIQKILNPSPKAGILQ